LDHIIPPQTSTTDSGHSDRHAALVCLHARHVDMIKGFAKMVEKAEPAFRDTALRFHTMHAHHADTLARLLSDLGVQPNTDGTLMGSVHVAVISVRAFFDEIDDDVMDQIRRGEEKLLEAFDEAIAENAAHGFHSTLKQMQTEVRETLNATHHLG
jgi:uncharacterized protein (TIGR02284 family)